MNRKTGLIITIVMAVLTLCCSLSCCTGGFSMFAGGDYGDVNIEPYYGTGPCCLSVLVWIIPLLLWFFLVRGKSDEEEIPTYQPPSPPPPAPEEPEEPEEPESPAWPESPDWPEESSEPADYKTVKLDDEGEDF